MARMIGLAGRKRGKRPSDAQREALARKLTELLTPETAVEMQAGSLIRPGRLRW